MLIPLKGRQRREEKKNLPFFVSLPKCPKAKVRGNKSIRVFQKGNRDSRTWDIISCSQDALAGSLIRGGEAKAYISTLGCDYAEQLLHLLHHSM